MFSFANDYAEGGHPAILQRMVDTGHEQQPGYGEDAYSKEARGFLRAAINQPDAAIHFVSGGTQANLLVIASLLRIHEAVISARSGHIFVHETGAIEALGHRVLTIEAEDGKLRPTAIEAVLNAHTMRPHVVKPRMVYISNSTELGTIYSHAELSALSEFCRSRALLLYVDGARLGHALTAGTNDLDLSAVAELTDVFTMGATKNGGFLGEAIVFPQPGLAPDFDYVLKQKGALLAKGRLLGLQFSTLFADGLYFELASHANRMANRMNAGLNALGYSFLTPTFTNQVFPILSESRVQGLRTRYHFYDWKRLESDAVAVRLVTSWATQEADVDEFLRFLSTIQPVRG